MSGSGERGGRTGRGRLGFSLIELVVALVVVSVLLAFVAPVAYRQYHRWAALKVARDLSHLRVALETFNGNVLNHPKRLTQMAYPITTSDNPLWHRAGNARTYTQAEVRRWNGPYIDNAIAQALGDEDAFESGLGIFIGNDVYCVTATMALGNCERGEWVSVYMFNVRVADFERVNDFVDPEEAGLSRAEKVDRGKLRFASYGGIAEDTEPGDVVYFATPYLADW